MFLLGWQIFYMSMVLAIVILKHATCLQFRRGLIFKRDVAYNGIVPKDESFYIKFFTNIGRIRCCRKCQNERPSCAGVLYDNEQMQCKLLKRYLKAADKEDSISHVGWGYWRITKDFDEDADCKRTPMGWEYIGKINVTESGRTCQAWASQSPHDHSTGTHLPENYCRNTDEIASPWCYTTDPDVRYEFCNIPMCVTPPRECLTEQDPTGRFYFGTQNVADTGDMCQRWDSQTPHEHRYDHLADQDNYCRNPDTEDAPWCYTVNPDNRYSKCVIPRC